jgi:hypothetical protein
LLQKCKCCIRCSLMPKPVVLCGYWTLDIG